MARLSGHVIPAQAPHLIQLGNNWQGIFVADADFHPFRDAWVEATRKPGLYVHAQGRMTNPVHLWAMPEFGHSICKVSQSVCRLYGWYLNGTYQRTGTLWEGRYRAMAVDCE